MFPENYRKMYMKVSNFLLRADNAPREVTELLRADAALTEDPSSIPRVHVRWLPTASTSSSRGKNRQGVVEPNKRPKPGMVIHTCNPSPWEAEAEGSRVQEQPQLHREFQPELHRTCV